MKPREKRLENFLKVINSCFYLKDVKIFVLYLLVNFKYNTQD